MGGYERVQVAKARLLISAVAVHILAFWCVSLSIRVPATGAPKFLWKSASWHYDYVAAGFWHVSPCLSNGLVVSEKKGLVLYSATY